MRILCLSAALCAAMASPALAQSAAPAATAAPAAAVKLTPSEVRALKLRITSVEMELRRELTRYFRANPGSGNPVSLTDAAMATGAAFTGKPVSEKHQLLVAERNEIAAKLIAAGEPLPRARGAATAGAPRASTAMTSPRGAASITGQQPAAWR